MSSDQRGKFISLEGGEGAGKSTLLEALAARLSAEGHKVVTSREPGGTPEGERLRTVILSGKWPVETALDLLHASRAHHCWKVIRPTLEQGSWVLVDRFVDSTFAYQANERPGWAREILEMSRLA
ncbi:dTMP kinase, partial [bacterium]|nr:dTMP kinase [bacterium]